MKPLDSGTTNAMNRSIGELIQLFRSRSYIIDGIEIDPEGSLVASVPYIQSCQIIPSLVAAGTKVVKAEQEIRTVKERARATISRLPFHLPKGFYKHLITFVCKRINSFPSRQYPGDPSPLEQMIARKLNYETDVKRAFGDYGQVPDDGDNTMKSRTSGCIALYPTYNEQGSWAVYNLNSNKVRITDRFIPLPMPNEVIAPSTISQRSKAERIFANRNLFFLRTVL